MGLRETKKQQTRAALSETASALFRERGFDQVSVAEIARMAGVSVNTAFNYFPTKEDLFFDSQPLAENHLADVVVTAPSDTTPADALLADLLGALQRRDPALGLCKDAAAFWRTVAESPTLTARSREIAERAERALAHALAERSGRQTGDPETHLLAGALCGAYRAAVGQIRQRAITGEDPSRVLDELGPTIEYLFSHLRGLAQPLPPPS
ncbi:TetR/AcrR family transcriptional regulator [Kitasatospora phosalacinea]|nr:TetR family transcriptional regulator [Kitasatospora phosalacinea]